MNYLAIISFIAITSIVVGGLKLSSDNLNIFVDYPSLFIVLGGTIAVIGMSFHLNHIIKLLYMFIKRYLTNHKLNFTAIVESQIQVINNIQNSGNITEQAIKSKDYFLQEGLTFIDEGLIESREIISIMKLRKAKIFAHYLDDANKVKTIAKYPPAFGMIGTTIGMVVLLANLGGEDAMKMIGPAMGVCILTTLYGTVIANAFFLPIADNMTESAQDIKMKNELNIKTIELILSETNTIIAAETLNSYLLPAHRVDWKKAIGA